MKSGNSKPWFRKLAPAWQEFRTKWERSKTRLKNRTHKILKEKMERQIIVSSDLPDSPGRKDRLMTVYEDLLRDIHNNSKQSWTMGTIFITASFAVFGVLLANWESLSSASLIVLGSAVLSLCLVWSWFWLSFFLADVGRKKYLIRSYIEIVLGLPRYEHVSPRKRGRYRLVGMPLTIHGVWLAIAFDFIPGSQSWESWFFIALFLSLLGFILGIVWNYHVITVENSIGEKMKEEWAQDSLL